MSVRIPKVFHRIWVGHEPLPETAKEFAAAWRENHPGWTMVLWTDENLPGQFNRGLYDRTRILAQRADILRHEVLCQYGGVYLDVDFECLSNIEPLLDDVVYFYGEELPGRPGTAILGCVAGHPFARWCQLRLRDRWPWQPGAILHETGPDFFARAIGTYVGGCEREAFTDPESRRIAGVRLMPADGLPLHAFSRWVFYPYSWSGSWLPEDHPDAYAVHHWHSNWKA